MAWSNKMSRRKKTTLTWVAASALGAGVLWLFWKDLFGVQVQHQLVLQKGTIKFTGKVTKEEADAYNTFNNSKQGIFESQVRAIVDEMRNGISASDMRKTLKDVDGSTDAELDKSFAEAYKQLVIK